MLGIEDPEIPASQVGNRRYARGRAYDPNRFGVQEEASVTEAIETESAVEASAEAAEKVTEEIVKEEK